MNKKAQSETSRSPLSKWWVSVLLAIIMYMVLKYLVPGLTPEGSSLYNVGQAAPDFAPLVAIPFLLLAAKQLYDNELPKNEHGESDHSNEEETPR